MNNIQSTTTTQQETDIGVLEIVVTFDINEVLTRISSNQSVIEEAEKMIQAEGTIRNCTLMARNNPQYKHTPGHRIQQMNFQ